MHTASNHVRDMLAHATGLHRTALAELTGTGDPKVRLRAAIRKLDDAQLLADDAQTYLDAPELAQALQTLAEQRQALTVALVQLDSMPPSPSPWAQPWPWLSLAVIGVTVALALS